MWSSLLTSVPANASLLKLISVRILDMLKLIAISILFLPVIVMSIGLAIILRGDPRTAGGYKRKSKN